MEDPLKGELDRAAETEAGLQDQEREREPLGGGGWGGGLEPGGSQSCRSRAGRRGGHNPDGAGLGDGGVGQRPVGAGLGDGQLWHRGFYPHSHPGSDSLAFGISLDTDHPAAAPRVPLSGPTHGAPVLTWSDGGGP